MNSSLAPVKALLTEQHLDAILISSVSNITYLTSYANFSKDEHEAFLLLTKNSQYIFTDGRYTIAVKKRIPNFVLVETNYSHPFLQNLKMIIEKKNVQTLGYEANNVTVAEFERISSSLAKIASETIRIIPTNLSLLRMMKTPSEIAAIQKACTIGDETFQYLLKKIKPQISEKELAFELEFFIKKQGADISFPPIVAFGANSAIPHHQTSNQRLKSNDFILFDFGVKYENYCSDMTRTIFFGKASRKQRKMYETVRVAQQKAIEYIQQYYSKGETKSKTNNSSRSLPNDKKLDASEVDAVARQYVISQDFPTFAHGLGHGIGIEVHETPFLTPTSKAYLENGMVFSIEPGIYIPDFSGVRIEDLFTIQKNKLMQLTQAPKDFIEV